MKFGYKFIINGKFLTMLFVLFFLPFSLFAKEDLVFGLTGTVYKGDLKTFKKWGEFLEKKLNKNVKIKFSRTYSEMISMIEHNKVDIAYVCNSTYVKLKNNKSASILAMPESGGKKYYYSYIITKASKFYKSIDNLEHKIFAFTDPDSTNGAIAPTYLLKQKGKDPKSFFAYTIYTYEHAESIKAVIDGFVDGASVDSLVYEQFAKRFPEKIKKIKVIQKIGPFTMSPIVANVNIDRETFLKIQQTLTLMHKDKEAKKILENLSLSKLAKPNNESFEEIEKMMNISE